MLHMFLEQERASGAKGEISILFGLLLQELEGLEERFVTNYDPDDPQFYEKSYYQAKETEHEPKEGQLGDNGNISEEEPYYFDGNNDENGEDYVADESPTTSGRPPKQNGSKGQEKEPNKTHEDVVADTVVIDRGKQNLLATMIGRCCNIASRLLPVHCRSSK